MKSEGLSFWLLSATVTFAAVGVFAETMISSDHNEHMYIAAGALIADGHHLYKDFAYLQTPYLPLFFGSLYRLFGVGSYFLLIGKLLTLLFLYGSALLLLLLARRVTQDIVLSLGVVSLFLLNMFIVTAAKEVSNYTMPMALSFAGIVAFDAAFDNPGVGRFLLGLSGLMLALAVGAKLTYLAAMLPFVALIVFCPALNRQAGLTVREGVSHCLVPFVIGAYIGLLPVLLYVIQDPALFAFNNYGYHNINGRFWMLNDYTGPMSLSEKLQYLRYVFFNANNLLVTVGILLGAAFAVDALSDVKRIVRQRSGGAILALLLFLAAVLVAMIPTPSTLQYYAMPVSFLLVLLVYALPFETLQISVWRRKLLVTLVLPCLAYTGPVFLRAIPDLMHRDQWSGLHVHDVATEIRKTLIDSGVSSSGKIATLSPLYAVEAGFQIYGQLSTGPFLYRIGESLTPEQRRHFVATSRESIGDVLEEDPPVAIIVGLEGPLDTPLVRYAEAHQYRALRVPGFKGTLYARI